MARGLPDIGRPKRSQKGQRTRKFADPVTFSIAVPLYRTPERYLREMIASVQAQTYPHWELCLANGSPEEEQLRKLLEEYAAEDPRICVKQLSENAGIAGNTNAALAMATGEYVGLLDHDDLLEPDALFQVMSTLDAARQRSSRCRSCSTPMRTRFPVMGVSTFSRT